MPAFLISSPRKFWRHLKPAKEGVGKIEVEGHTIQDEYGIAKCFNHFFSTVFSTDDGTTPVFDNLEDVPPIPDVSLSLDGMVDLLLNLDCKKATCYDKIPFFLRLSETLR